jgi:GH15 family glucan-1,4-alpha-glucosidase
MTYRPISDYGIVGNDDRIALVDTAGSIDWCCFPSVSSPSVFAAILDYERGGHFSIAPTDQYESEQRYREATNVLETVFETGSGRATLTDFMPVSDRDRDNGFQHSLYRQLRCEEGRLTIQADFKPRLDYARADTSVADNGAYFSATDGDGETLSLQTRGPLELDAKDGRAVGSTTLEAGDSVWFVLEYDHYRSRSRGDCERAEAETVEYWQDWASNVEDAAEDIAEGTDWYDAVVRSALVLKLLINEETGAIYAAATTSLPESYGGSSNWDYRYNWIRDAKFTVQALFNLGQTEEASDYFEWFRGLSHDDPEEIQPVYGTHGERDLSEQHLDHLAGHQFSSPVRIGNAAADQRQLDVYGAIVQGLYETLLHDKRISEEDWQSIRRLVDHVCDVWNEKGAGIWEFRGEPRHYVHSKLLCWVALDRGIELAGYHDDEIDVSPWEQERAALRDAIERRGYSESSGSFVQHFETEETLDATCLLLPIYKFLPADDDRIQSTLDVVMDELLTDDGLVHRTSGPDSRSEGPGAFLFCTFWLVNALVLADRVSEARAIFTDALEHVGSPPLLSERVDPSTGEYYGNFPQAFSHIGLVNSAIYLQCANDDHSLEHDPLAENDIQPLFRT